MEMIFTIPKESILKQLISQLNLMFSLTLEEKKIITIRFDYALQACKENFRVNENKYFHCISGGGKIQSLSLCSIYDILVLSIS